MGTAAAAHLDAVDSADVGVLAYRRRSGRPLACAVTPYVEGGEVVVTSTLALPAKAAAMQREGAAALLAGGVLVRGSVSVTVDRTSGELDRWIREQELRKFPPARALLAVPGHRRLFPWYVGRIIVRFVDPEVTVVGGGDRCTLTTLGADGRPVIGPGPEPPADPSGWVVDAGDRPAGPACVLVHEETEAMAELRQLRVDGVIEAGTFAASAVVGSLAPQDTGLPAQVAELRRLARSATRNRAVVDRLVAAAGTGARR